MDPSVGGTAAGEAKIPVRSADPKPGSASVYRARTDERIVVTVACLHTP